MFIIDVLYIKDCIGKEKAVENLNKALDVLNFDENEYFVNIKEITKEKEAKLWKLAGSPTVKVNGVDVEFGINNYGMFKRVYNGTQDAPDIETIKHALRMDIRERARLIDEYQHQEIKPMKEPVCV